MKALFRLAAAILTFTLLAQAADLTAYNKPRSSSVVPASFRLYMQVPMQDLPTSLTDVVTQLTGCSSAVTGGTAGTLTNQCGVYIDTITISCPAASAGTILVQDLQSTPLPLVPSIANTATTMYTLNFNWAWMLGGFKVRQVTGSGCKFSASWGVL